MALTDIPLEYSTQLGVPLDLLCKARLELRQGINASDISVMAVIEDGRDVFFD